MLTITKRSVPTCLRTRMYGSVVYYGIFGRMVSTIISQQYNTYSKLEKKRLARQERVLFSILKQQWCLAVAWSFLFKMLDRF